MKIYLIKNLINGKCYIGQTRRKISKRFKGHCRTASKGGKSIIHQAIAKHGVENFTIEELATAIDQVELDRLEQQFIEQYGTMAPNGYNLKTGGQNGGSQYSDESKQKMSLAKIGSSASDETRQRMSDAHNKRWSSQELRDRKSETSRKIWQDPEYREKITATRTEYWSDPANRERASVTAKEFTTEEQKQKISEAVKTSQARPEIQEKMKTFYKTRQKKVVDSNGVIYESIKIAAETVGCPSASIVRVIKGQYKTAGGLTWKYADET